MVNVWTVIVRLWLYAVCIIRTEKGKKNKIKIAKGKK